MRHRLFWLVVHTRQKARVVIVRRMVSSGRSRRSMLNLAWRNADQNEILRANPFRSKA